MEDIGQLGIEKYGDNSIVQKFGKGDFSRTYRTWTGEILDHIQNHALEYRNGILHDVFKTRVHQLAAIAFNAMIEAQYIESEYQQATVAINKRLGLGADEL
jgi:maltooligosyltrehalose synthase